MKDKLKVTRRSGVEEARRNLPALLELASRGESSLVTKHGRDYAAIVPPQFLTMLAPGPSVMSLRGTGKGLWGRSASRAVRRLRDEWE
jgi:antitoxin (DNA-binding transcriptional repressor) of toxin-antitoxin stability system